MNEREVITENLKKLPIGKSVNLLHVVSMFIITELYTQSLRKLFPQNDTQLLMRNNNL